MIWKQACIASLAALALGSQAMAAQIGPLPDIQRGTIALQLLPIAAGLGAPDYAISPPGDANRLFVVEQKGLLLVIQNGGLLFTPALDIQSLIGASINPANANDERGFLGLAFHPGFNTPGHVGFLTLYTFNSQPIPVGTLPTYSAPNGAVQGYKTVVNEWKMSAADPDIVDPASRREVISFGKNANNHNGGTITFGPDGYAYLALGDGGNANDVGASHIEPGGNAQNLSTPLGKMLRFDPVNPALTPGSTDPISGNGQYRIPATNPFQGAGQVPEIYAYGLRNPYRFSFDRSTGDLIQADVGQNNIEEIDRIVLGGNYGWAIKEGDFLFNRITGPDGAAGTIGIRSPGSPAGLIDPLSGPLGSLEYDHSDGISITGGFVYRGAAIPELFGKYVFGDLAIRNAPPRVDGRLFYADLSSGEMLEFLLPQFLGDKLPNGLTVHGFGQDDSGELYAVVTNTPANGVGGIVYKLVPQFATATLLARFAGAAESDGVRLRWRFQDPSEFVSVRVERSTLESGPWIEIETERSVVAGDEEALDRTVSPGMTYYYRLSGTDRSGVVTTFGAIAATAGEAFSAPAITRIVPNPSAGPIEVEFVLPRPGAASLRLLDLQGRAVTTLASGPFAAGRNRVPWSGITAHGSLTAGLYFLELRSNGVVRTQRVVLTP